MSKKYFILQHESIIFAREKQPTDDVKALFHKEQQDQVFIVADQVVAGDEAQALEIYRQHPNKSDYQSAILRLSIERSGYQPQAIAPADSHSINSSSINSHPENQESPSANYSGIGMGGVVLIIFLIFKMINYAITEERNKNEAIAIQHARQALESSQRQMEEERRSMQTIEGLDPANVLLLQALMQAQQASQEAPQEHPENNKEEAEKTTPDS